MSAPRGFRFLSSSSSRPSGDQMARLARPEGGKEVICYVTIPEDLFPGENEPIKDLLAHSTFALPTGEWNTARLGRDCETGELRIFDAQTKELLGLNEETWEPTSVDYFELTQHDGVLKTGDATDRVKLVSNPDFNDGKKMVMKIMAIPDLAEKKHMVREIRAYNRLQGHGVAPKFLGFVTEHGRTIGFLIDYIEGARKPGSDPEEIEKCLGAVLNFQEKGLIHGDLNGGSFLIKGDKTTIIDFKNAVATQDEDEHSWDLDTMFEWFSQTFGFY